MLAAALMAEADTAPVGRLHPALGPGKDAPVPETPLPVGTALAEMAQLLHALAQPMLVRVPGPLRSQDAPALQTSPHTQRPLMATGTPSERERARRRQ